MARARRRSTRGNPQKSPESPLSPVSSATPQDPGSPADAQQPARSKEDTCPACKDNNDIELNAVEKESWIRCDACKTWFHWRCAGDGSDLEAIDKWFCKECTTAEPSRVVTLKPPARKSARKRTQRDYANMNSGLESDPARWTRILQEKSISEDRFKRMKGKDVTLDWVDTDDDAMREPFVVESPEGLGMKMPPQDLTVDDIAEIVGEDTPLEVIDVASQSNAPGWTLGKWAEYFNLEPPERDKVRNVISLEISGTKLADQVLQPRLVRELDWVEKFWPSTRRGKGHAYPKVQLYCLMGVASAWTDWHIDFAGSSVYYHLLHGTKVFYFIRPTPANLAAYERWSGTEIQSHQWLGDLVDEVIKVTLHAGNTMFIPTGWIHAVHTPVDSLVFGGNFLHSYNMGTQLRVRDIEIATRVPNKFRFPFFSKLCWYAGDKYLRDLKAKEEFSPRVLESIELLANFLVSEARNIERGTEHAKKETKDQVPGDRVKDPAAVARELRWRARLAAGHDSDDESSGAQKEGLNGTAHKRRRVDIEEHTAKFKNFVPKQWPRVAEREPQIETKISRAQKPADEQMLDEHWLEWKDAFDDGEEVTVTRRRDVVVKVRRTGKGGVERQRVERVLEEWTWDEAAKAEAPDEKMIVDEA
ncbi:hypothetical protein PLICRDRAFT_40504 [Plicaturopsis crispa FD-325 SS-3]|nr:hypothetical protein PLICRDRAFT_40504 [Plicaturopsis crispa FD-325 SS-3]